MSVSKNSIAAGPFKWFYRKAGQDRSDSPPVLLLHGLPSHSFGWRAILPVLADKGFRVFAPDWVGFGASDKPGAREFDYTPDAFVNALEEFVSALNIEKFSLIVQGFLGSVGIQYALRHPHRIERLAILNAPIAVTAKLPWKIKQLGLPLLGDMLTQNPLSVDSTLEGGGRTAISDRDLAIFRQPYSESGDAGRVLMTTIRNLQLPQSMAEIASGFLPWRQPDTQVPPFPVTIIWAVKDRYLPVKMAQDFATTHIRVDLFLIREGGHYPQEEVPEDVNVALLRFLRQ
ncbi:MAG: alpha/beta fold hydrolase [Gemmatimonadaceae bacterium]|nr:alpha/beta fold hydrolase [Gloeobacterales cyanobacterium ES-bin-141]